MKDFIKSFWHELYLEMLSNPTDNRTDKKFCEDIKIHINTLGNWKREHRKEIFHEVGRRRSQYVDELRATAWKSLAEKMPKDTNAIKLAFQLLGDLVEKSEVKTEMMSRKDILDRANSLLKEFNTKKETWKKVEESNGQETREEKKAVDSGVEGVKISPNLNDGVLGDEPGENPH